MRGNVRLAVISADPYQVSPFCNRCYKVL
jgi:hypothetical protein